MPGVPSGKGCDACRKQKKKVRCASDYLENNVADVKVRSSETTMLKVCTIEYFLCRLWPAEIRLQDTGHRIKSLQ